MIPGKEGLTIEKEEIAKGETKKYSSKLTTHSSALNKTPNTEENCGVKTSCKALGFKQTNSGPSSVTEKVLTLDRGQSSDKRRTANTLSSSWM